MKDLKRFSLVMTANFRGSLVLALLMNGFNSASAQGLFIEGQSLSDREYNTDQTQAYQFVLDFTVTQAGTLRNFLTWGQNSGEGIRGVGEFFHGYVLRPMGSNSFQVLMKTGPLTVTNEGTNIFEAPPFDLQVGDLIAHYGTGIPLSIETGGPSSVYIVTNIDDFPLPMPVVGTTIEVPGPIYILYDDGGRDYAIAIAVSTVPNLDITQTGGTVTVSWPAVGANTLLQTTNLDCGIWTTNADFISANGTNSVTIAAPIGNLFFRLRGP